jgi:hypothetical protein
MGPQTYILESLMEKGHENLSLETHESLQVRNKRIHDVKLDFVGVQEIRWNEGGNESADIYTCSCSKGNAIYYFGTFSYIVESDDDTSLLLIECCMIT